MAKTIFILPLVFSSILQAGGGQSKAGGIAPLAHLANPGIADSKGQPASLSDPQIADNVLPASLPSDWKACHVTRFYLEKGHDRLYSSSKSAWESIKNAKRTITKGAVNLNISGASFGLWEEERPSWSNEGTAGYFYTENFAPAFMGPVYRLYEHGQHHFYTMKASEKNQLLANGGNWVDEGIEGYLVKEDKIQAFRKQYGIQNGSAWYRLYAMHDHFWTTSKTERDTCLVSGYKDEGLLGYLY
jgi:hypothetical protein